MAEMMQMNASILWEVSRTLVYREEENKGRPQDGAVRKTNNLSDVPRGDTHVPSGGGNPGEGILQLRSLTGELLSV